MLHLHYTCAAHMLQQDGHPLPLARMELLRQGVEVGDIDLGASSQEQLTDYREATGAPTRRRLLPRFAAL